MTQSPIGGSAQPVYPVSSRAGVAGRAAQRVFKVTDNRPVLGGPAQSVYYVSVTSELATRYGITL